MEAHEPTLPSFTVHRALLRQSPLPSLQGQGVADTAAAGLGLSPGGTADTDRQEADVGAAMAAGAGSSEL